MYIDSKNTSITGFSVSPPPANRQSSDSALSIHTDTSNQTKPSFTSEPEPSKRNSRKRSHESVEDVSVSSKSHDIRPTSSKRVEELRNSHKKPKKSGNYYADSDYEDNGASHFSAETDSDEPLLKDNFKCKLCAKQFQSLKSLASHSRVHSRTKTKDVLPENVVVNIPKTNLQDASDVDDQLGCEKCGKSFKLKIMLNRHRESCGKSPQKSPIKPFEKELLISLEPIDGIHGSKKIDCQMCTTKFKTIENLEKHMKVVHAAVLQNSSLRLNQITAKYRFLVFTVKGRSMIIMFTVNTSASVLKILTLQHLNALCAEKLLHERQHIFVISKMCTLSLACGRSSQRRSRRQRRRSRVSSSAACAASDWRLSSYSSRTSQRTYPTSTAPTTSPGNFDPTIFCQFSLN